MIYDCILRDSVVPLRGDYPSVDTHVRESFTRSDLDKIAPLAHGDSSWLGENCCPSYETILRVEQRIKAAQILKYGRSDEA